MPVWHELSISAAVEQLAVDSSRGLTAEEVATRQKEHGPNELEEHGAKSPWTILWEQLTGILVIVLIVAAGVSLFLGDYPDAIVILIIVVLNALIGFRQEYKAEKSMAALKKMSSPTVTVRRAGHVKEVPSTELTVGDIVLLEAGSAIPADGRLLETVNLRVQEAALTGESAAVEKHCEETFEEETPLGDRLNVAYMGTAVSYGRGTMAVTAIGMQTKLGHIANMIQSVAPEQTPLQKRLDRLGKILAGAVLVIVVVLFVIGWMRGQETIETLFLTSVSLAVAAVPEGLPAVVTIALALGAQRMLKRKALIRKLPAVETLGSVTTICSDKTGTLTKNEMTVTVLDVVGRRVDVTQGEADDGTSHLTTSEKDRLELSEHPALALLVVGGALCNDALLDDDEPDPADLHIVGDPTEAALVAAAARLGVVKQELEAILPRVGELPFDSDRKCMSTMHQWQKEGASRLPPVLTKASEVLGSTNQDCRVAFTKGAIDRVLQVCTHWWSDGNLEPLTEERLERINSAHDRLADHGMRVLGLAYREYPSDYKGDLEESELVFLGLSGMIDPPRAEAAEAVAECRTAGIRPLMITGDHPLTAKHIAEELGIDTAAGVVTGRELDQLSDQQLKEVVRDTSVFARVSPENKLQLVKALQANGQVSAMTGDGVNDAPSLKQADIGVAMGITGTDVSKEAADMVLLNDNFATIVAAVREGRVVYDNIRKFIQYTMTSNAGEIWVMLAAPLFGMPLPLLPLQILWINLVTDGLPGLALALEPGERDTMRRPPHPPNESILARGMAWHIIVIGLLMGFVSLLTGWWYWREGIGATEEAQHGYWRTMVFMVLTLSQMGHVLAVRSQRDSLFRIGILSNRWMLAAVTLTFVLQLAITYIPFFQTIFKTVPLGMVDLGIALGLSTIVFWAVEGQKLIGRMRSA